MAESPGRHLPGLLSWYLEQNLALYQMGVERATCQLHMGSNSSNHSFIQQIFTKLL